MKLSRTRIQALQHRGKNITAGATGWGETEVFMEVSSRRLATVQHRHLPARGLLSLFSLLRAFLLNAIKPNQAGGGLSWWLLPLAAVTAEAFAASRRSWRRSLPLRGGHGSRRRSFFKSTQKQRKKSLHMRHPPFFLNFYHRNLLGVCTSSASRHLRRQAKFSANRTAPKVHNTLSGVPPREAPFRLIDLGEVALRSLPT